MPTDALATLGARASAGMVLNPKAPIFRRQHHKSYDYRQMRNGCGFSDQVSTNEPVVAVTTGSGYGWVPSGTKPFLVAILVYSQ